MTILEHIPLKDYTTFKIGGPASFFVVVKTVEELQDAVNFARNKNLKMFFLGGGSNIVMSDEGYDGLVIKIELGGIEIKDTELISGAGIGWDDLVAYAIEHNLAGLENLSYIPGTVGAAPVQNIGAYGSEVKDTIMWVEAINSQTGELVTFTNEQCMFGYRTSYFKSPEGKKLCITRVAFQLHKEKTVNSSYRDIAEYIRTHNLTTVTLADVRAMVIEIRKKKLPDVKVFGTAGSFFKNPIITKTQYELLLTKYPLLPHYVVDNEHVKIPAAWVLDNICGFKGYREGNIGVYNNQALVLVNFSDATAEQIKSLAQKMISCVEEKISVTLEREVLYI